MVWPYSFAPGVAVAGSKNAVSHRIDEDRAVEIEVKLDRLAGAMHVVRLDLGNDRAAAQPYGDIGARAGRLDEVDDGWQPDRTGAGVASARARQMLWPDAER